MDHSSGMHSALRHRLALVVLALCIGHGAWATDPPGKGHQDTVSAVVMYGNETLLDSDLALSDEDLDQILDSLCTSDDAPEELIRYLRLFKRIRTMGEDEMVVLIDSLFELDTVPYALINEINLYADNLPMGTDVEASNTLSWYSGREYPADDLYGPWNTTDPNAYGPELSRHDSLMLIQLVDLDKNCGHAMPIEGVITSRFGWRDGRPHNGVDIDLEVWDPVRSMFPGVVRFSGVFGGFGRLVVVRHHNGLETFYAHLHRFKVRTGDVVEAGQVVGLGGSSGHSTGSHLHLEVRFKGIPIDPSRLVDLETGALHANTLVLKKTRWSYAAYPQGTRFHTVQKGDHLYAIAERYGTSSGQLCELNGVSKRSILRVGQTLLVAEDTAER